MSEERREITFVIDEPPYSDANYRAYLKPMTYSDRDGKIEGLGETEMEAISRAATHMDQDNTLRDVARLGIRLGDTDGMLFRTTLRAFAQSRHEPYTPENLQFVREELSTEFPERDRDAIDSFLRLFRTSLTIEDADWLRVVEQRLLNTYRTQMVLVHDE
ncbi:hypothetical protein [Halocatena marina]|uniref:Uncharacterized protein n=1 Tax=Halocatena marina TaxID=2934937 RepID=A0ABD5YXT5_9EURY|nr:hypothetical protein [Halocatena marina]